MSGFEAVAQEGAVVRATHQLLRQSGTGRRCDSCGCEERPEELFVVRIIAGMNVWMCRDPAACRQRAQLAGVWCRYEPVRP